MDSFGRKAKTFTSHLSSSLFSLSPPCFCPFCRIVSTIHATLAVSAALYTIFLEGELYKEGVEFGKRMSLGIDITASLTLSYWIYDLALIMV